MFLCLIENMDLKKTVGEVLLLVVLTCIGVYIYQTNQNSEYRETIVGKFTGTKGCMGIVNEVLITDLANKCNETEIYLNKTVEVTGTIYKPECEPDSQCYGGKHMKDIESIRVID
jgi:hypothetical protein